MKLRKYTYILALALAVVTTAACSDDEQWTGQEELFTIEVPIRIIPAQPQTETRAIGDPGLDDRLDPPTNLYVFSWLKTSAQGNDYEFYYTALTGLTADNWEYVLAVDETDQSGTSDNSNGSELKHDETSHYKLTEPIHLRFNTYPDVTTDQFEANAVLGRTYVIASDRELMTSELETLVEDTYKGIITSKSSIKFTGAEVETCLHDASLSCPTTGDDPWTSDDFRDLYSNPIGETVLDARNIENGRLIKYVGDDGSPTIAHGDIRLYHAAAKYDFTWEVAKELQSTIAVNTITVTGLPTQCKIFDPVNNPYGTSVETASAEVITTDTGSQWLGRGVVYGLQRNDAALPYTVTFKDVDGDGTTKGDVTPTPFAPTKKEVFTGWYRVIATVN